jgi:excisionase family DNA binding protein/YgiT-type zinc finger domain-containing protein
MKCFFCDTEMKETKTEIKTSWGDYQIIIKGVQAEVCPDCGEKVLNSVEIKMIQDIAQGFAELPSNKPDILNVEEVANMLRVSEQTVYNMLKDGRLKATKVGREWRFPKEAVNILMGVQQEKTPLTLTARALEGKIL